MTQSKLESQINQVNKDIRRATSEIGKLNNLIKQKSEHRDRLTKQIAELAAKPPEPPRISDHALLRYAERVLNFNREYVTELLLTQQVLEMIKVCGPDGTYPAEGCSLVMKDNVVVTIIPNP